MAMLRGMGWDPKVGIGKTFKQNVKVLETTLRPKGLGLGASAPNPSHKDKQNHQSAKEETSYEVKVGAYVKVRSGSHKNKYGVVDGLDPDNALCIVKFALGGKTASVGQFNVEVVPKTEYVKFGKDLSRLTKAHEFSERRKEASKYNNRNVSNHSEKSSNRKQDRHSKHKRRHVSPNEDHNKDRDFDRENGLKHQKRKRVKESHASRDADDYEKKKKKKHKKEKKTYYNDSDDGFDRVSKTNSQKTWLLPNLRVRMVDQSYKKGKYYREKLLVVDVFSSKGHCSCKTERGTLLDDIHEDMLETVLPRY